MTLQNIPQMPKLEELDIQNLDYDLIMDDLKKLDELYGNTYYGYASSIL
jgi:hypothetical protein